MSDIFNKFFLFNEQDLFEFKTISAEKTRTLAKSLLKAIGKKSELNNEIKLSLSKDEVERFRSICHFVISSDAYDEKICDQMEFDDLIWKLKGDKTSKPEVKLNKIFNFFGFKQKTRYDQFTIQIAYDSFVTGQIDQSFLDNMSAQDRTKAIELINEFNGKILAKPSHRLSGRPKKKQSSSNNVSPQRAHKIALILVGLVFGINEPDAVRQHIKTTKSTPK